MNRQQMNSFIQGLNESEKCQVLSGLLIEHPYITKKVYDIAKNIVCSVDADSIMDDVFFELNILDMDDLSSHAG